MSHRDRRDVPPGRRKAAGDSEGVSSKVFDVLRRVAETARMAVFRAFQTASHTSRVASSIATPRAPRRKPWNAVSMGHCRRTLVLSAALIVLASPRVSAAEEGRTRAFTAGQLLVATPEMADPRFAHTVILMVDHNADGAMGLIVNRRVGEGPLKSLLEGFGMDAESASGTVRLHYGGPVDPARGFVLHSTDYSGQTTKRIDESLALTMGPDILTAFANGEGPNKSRVIFGYAGWGPGQLESEMARDDWLTAPADESLIFDEDLETVWERAIENAGLSL